MTSQPDRSTADNVYKQLRRLAREQGRATDELFQLYLLERFIFRWASSQHADGLVLKGGMLLAAYDLRRATRDIDVQALAVDGEVGLLTALVGEICAVEVDDGVTFDLSQLDARSIREGAAFEGLRVRVPAALGRAQLVLRLDINIGDPITPAPAQLAYPQLLGGTFTLTGYPLASVLAEKLVTMLELREANTRDRDIGDIVRIIDTHPIDSDELRAGCEATAAYRGVQLDRLAGHVNELAVRRQAPWSRWRNRMGLQAALPDAVRDALDRVTQFADPVLEGAVHAATWNPASGRWQPRETRATTRRLT